MQDTPYLFFTVWYDEMCLIENPSFRSPDINCWACEEVRSVLDLSEMHNPRDFQPHTGFPYIVKVGLCYNYLYTSSKERFIFK